MFFNGTQNISDSLLKNTPHFPPLNNINIFNKSRTIIKHRVLVKKLKEKNQEANVNNNSDKSKVNIDFDFDFHFQKSKATDSPNQNDYQQKFIESSVSNKFNFRLKKLDNSKNITNGKNIKNSKNLKKKSVKNAFETGINPNLLEITKDFNDYQACKASSDFKRSKNWTTSLSNNSEKNSKRSETYILTKEKIEPFPEFIGMTDEGEKKYNSSLDPKSISFRIVQYAPHFKNLAFQMMNNIEIKKYLCKIQFTELVRNRAAIIIQKNYRGYIVRKKYRNDLKKGIISYKERQFREVKNKWIQTHARIDFNEKKVSIFNIRCQNFIDHFKFVVIKKLRYFIAPILELLLECKQISNDSNNIQKNESLCKTSQIYKFPKLKSSFSKAKQNEASIKKIKKIKKSRELDKQYSNSTTSNILNIPNSSNLSNLSNSFKISKKVELKSISKQFQIPESRNINEQIYKVSQSFADLAEKEKRKVAIFGSSDAKARDHNLSFRILNHIISSPEQIDMGNSSALNELKRIVNKKKSMIKYINRKYIDRSFIQKRKLNEKSPPDRFE